MHKADNLPPSCAIVTKSGNLNFLELSVPVQACNAIALPFTYRPTGSRDRSVGISTHHGLGGLVIEFKNSLACPDRPWDTPSFVYNGYRVFPEGKAAGAWR